jgi:hypothetical protein
VRLPAGHGGGDSSSEVLVDGEGEKTGSAVAFFRQGGATVAGGGPSTARREGKVSSTLHGRRTATGELGRRSPWTCSQWRRWPDSDGCGARTATVSFGPGYGAVGTSKARRFGQRRRRGRNGAVGTPVRSPDSAFNALERRGARRLTGGTQSSAFSELKFTPDGNSSK